MTVFLTYALLFVIVVGLLYRTSRRRKSVECVCAEVERATVELGKQAYESYCRRYSRPPTGLTSEGRVTAGPRN